MNTIHEINAGQLNVDSNTGEAEIQDAPTPTHTYNLWPRPTKRNKKYRMTQMGQQSTIAKPHIHVMLTQISIKEGIRRFAEKGNDALIKKLNQLHERNTLLPKRK